MNEKYPNNPEQQKAQLYVEAEYVSHIPEEFREDPFKYFETHGVNIKQGEILKDENGNVREDPTAVKDFPVWKDLHDKELYTVAKKVNVSKGHVGKSGDPFYEYKIMQYVRSKGLPCPAPIAQISARDSHLIIMERVPGLRWSYRHSLIKEGFTNEDVDRLHRKAEVEMETLKNQFEKHGIFRDWKLSDMVFNIDMKNKQLLSITPVDWERTVIKIDETATTDETGMSTE